MNLLTDSQRDIMVQLGFTVDARTKSQVLGPHKVAILLVVCLLEDQGQTCNTDVNISKYAGQSRAVTRKHVIDLTNSGWLDDTGTSCARGECTPRTRHYRSTPG